MRFNCLDAYYQNRRNLLVALALGEEARDFNLARAQFSHDILVRFFVWPRNWAVVRRISPSDEVGFKTHSRSGFDRDIAYVSSLPDRVFERNQIHNPASYIRTSGHFRYDHQPEDWFPSYENLKHSFFHWASNDAENLSNGLPLVVFGGETVHCGPRAIYDDDAEVTITDAHADRRGVKHGVE